MSNSDSEDEISTQDWRFLDSKVLKRGEKDHAPDGTDLQQTYLDQSRQAMYTALSNPVSIASKSLIEADWNPARYAARIRKLKGNFFQSMGWAEREQMYFLPEEIIYLVQRGSLRLYSNNKLLTEQGVTALCLPLIGIEKLQVYTHFKRLGFIVRRDIYSEKSQVDYLPPKYTPSVATSVAWAIAGRLFNKLAWQPAYPSYNSIFRDLRTSQIGFSRYNPKFADKFDFLVWKPGSAFRKSAPPPADYKIRVKSADIPVPSASEMHSDFTLTSVNLSTKQNLVQRMREGYRSFIYAVVDNGIVSFIRVAQTLPEPCLQEPDHQKLADLHLVC